jgi:hypothetical protein
MKKLLLVLTVVLLPIYAYAQDIIIDERITDIYYANGVANTREQALVSLTDIIRPSALQDIYSNDESAMLRETDYKLLYNQSYTIIPDLLEAFEQKKQDHRWFWAALDVVVSAGCDYFQGGKLKEIVRSLLTDLIKDLIADHAAAFNNDPAASVS